MYDYELDEDYTVRNYMHPDGRVHTEEDWLDIIQEHLDNNTLEEWYGFPIDDSPNWRRPVTLLASLEYIKPEKDEGEYR